MEAIEFTTDTINGHSLKYKDKVIRLSFDDGETLYAEMYRARADYAIEQEKHPSPVCIVSSFVTEALFSLARKSKHWKGLVENLVI